MSTLNCVMFDPKQKVLTLVAILMQLNLTNDIHEYFKQRRIKTDEFHKRAHKFIYEIIEDCYNNKIDMSIDSIVRCQGTHKTQVRMEFTETQESTRAFFPFFLVFQVISPNGRKKVIPT